MTDIGKEIQSILCDLKLPDKDSLLLDVRALKAELARAREDRDFYQRNWDVALIRYERLIDETDKAEKKVLTLTLLLLEVREAWKVGDMKKIGELVQEIEAHAPTHG